MRMAFAALALGLATGCASSHSIRPQVADTGIDFSRAESLEVRLSSFAFNPSDIHMQAGKPYALKLVDVSGGHDFTAPQFFAAAKIAPEDVAKVAKGQIELKAGDSTTIHLVPAAGQYDLACTHFGHAALGMKGKIMVQGAS